MLRLLKCILVAMFVHMSHMFLTSVLFKDFDIVLSYVIGVLILDIKEFKLNRTFTEHDCQLTQYKSECVKIKLTRSCPG